MEIVQQEGNRKVSRQLEHYNLDIVLAVGYRTNSSKAIKFRQWATSVLKNYIQNGYVINAHKLTEQRLNLIDNYIDESVLTLFSKNTQIELLIYTTNITEQLKLDVKKYNIQYKNLQIKEIKIFHDRFLIIDEKVYHFGASLKDLAKKSFAFSRFDSISCEEIISKVRGR